MLYRCWKTRVGLEGQKMRIRAWYERLRVLVVGEVDITSGSWPGKVLMLENGLRLIIALQSHCSEIIWMGCLGRRAHYILKTLI